MLSPFNLRYIFRKSHGLITLKPLRSLMEASVELVSKDFLNVKFDDDNVSGKNEKIVLAYKSQFT